MVPVRPRSSPSLDEHARPRPRRCSALFIAAFEFAIVSAIPIGAELVPGAPGRGIGTMVAFGTRRAGRRRRSRRRGCTSASAGAGGPARRPAFAAVAGVAMLARQPPARPAGPPRCDRVGRRAQGRRHLLRIARPSSRSSRSPTSCRRPGQVVIDVEAAGVNFVDALIVQGRYQITPPLPYTPGIGGRRHHRRGRRRRRRARASATACRAAGRGGGYASQVAVPAPAVVPDPGQPDAPARRPGSCRATPRCSTRYTRRTTVPAGEWFAVLGAGGGIGLAAVDLATALGAQVVACASTRREAGAGPGGRGGRDDRLRRRRRPEDGDPRGHRRWRRPRRRPDRRRQGRGGAAQPALGGSLPGGRVRRRRDPPLPAQPGAAQQPHA